MHLGTAEDIRIADRAVFEDDAVAGKDIRIRIVTHSVTHEAGLARLADRTRDSAVGHDASARNASHDVECLVGECAHGSIIEVSGARADTQKKKRTKQKTEIELQVKHNELKHGSKTKINSGGMLFHPNKVTFNIKGQNR